MANVKKTQQNEQKSIADFLKQYIFKKILEFEEVSRFVGNIAENIQKNILNIPLGIKIKKDGEALIIDVHIAVYYGTNISKLAYEIQNKLKESIEKDLEFNISGINVNVDCVERITKK